MTLHTDIMANGLRIVTETMPHATTVGMAIGVGVGSRDEKRGQEGISHMLEHMLFRGTKNHSEDMMNRKLDYIAAWRNGGTSREVTSITAEVLPKNARESFALLAEIMQHPKLDEAHLPSERKVVLSELLDDKDDTQEQTHELVHRSAFPGQRFGGKIIGKANILKRITPEELRAFFKEHYRPDNMVVSFNGAISREEALKMVQEEFHTTLAPDATLPPPPPAAKLRFHPANVTLPKSGISQSYGRMVYSLPKENPGFSRAAILAYNNLLAGYTTARLNEQIRYKLGLSYAVDGILENGRQNYLLQIDVSGFHGSPKRLRDIMDRNIAEMGEHGITQEELGRSRNQGIMNLHKLYQDPRSAADTLCDQMLIDGKVHSREKSIHAAEAVTIDEINRVARFVASQKPAIAFLEKEKTASR